MAYNIFTSNWSNQYTRQFFIGSFFMICILAMSISLMQASLSCIDSDGCFKRHCDLSMFDAKYTAAIQKMHTSNGCLRNILHTEKGVNDAEPKGVAV